MTNVQSKIVGVRELRGNLSAILARVKAGESLDIVRRGRKIAVLSAPVAHDENWWPSDDPNSPNFRRPVALKSKMWMSDDFNDPDRELEAMMKADIFPLCTALSIMTTDSAIQRDPVQTIGCR